MSHDKFFGICKNKCLVEINANSVGAAAQDLSNIDNEVFAEKATAAGVGGGGGIVSEVVPIENGGTGATTAEEARTNLNVAVADHTHTLEEITGSSVLPIEKGGTGATTAEEARTNLNVASVDHTHTLEEVTGSSVLAIENGGTGATTAEDARNNLGVASSDLSNVDNTVFLEKATTAGVGGGSGTVLYSNESGTTDETITLSDDISNYKYVEIEYSNAITAQYLTYYNQVVKGFVANDGSVKILFSRFRATDSEQFYGFANFVINGSALSVPGTRQKGWKNSTKNDYTFSAITIYKVIGYK